MILWRISAFADLSSRGGLLTSGRWHRAGNPVVYLAESPAGAMLEVLVHLEVDPEDLPDNLRLMRIHIPEQVAASTAQPNLPDHWFDHMGMTQAIGSAWLQSQDTVLLQVPGAIMPHTHNWLLNPSHPLAQQLTITVESLQLDKRLFKHR